PTTSCRLPLNTSYHYTAISLVLHYFLFFFFFNHTAPPQIYTLSLHDALPISRDDAGTLRREGPEQRLRALVRAVLAPHHAEHREDRKSTRLNSSHDQISYAVFCLKKKKKNTKY